MIPSFAQCRPIAKRSDIEECLANPPQWVNRVIPLKKRSGFVIQNTLTDCHSPEGQFCVRPRIDSRTVPKTLVCHDYKGGYLSDSYIPFEGMEDGTLATDGYTFYNWAQIDYFVYFSHYFITIPPLAWINAGHKNGVKVLGTIITENLDGIKTCNEDIFQTESRMKEFVYRLIEIQKTFGFDGWLLNIENPVQNPDILKRFVQVLTEQTHHQDSESVIIWYDSVINNGELKWQDSLNDLNRCYFDACDGIFLNYGWNEEKLKNTVAAAGARHFDVFVGIDVFGRNMFGGGQFNTYKAAELITKYNLSMAIFAPGWTHETMEKMPAENAFNRFLNRDDALWASLWPYLYTHPIIDFFETNFHVGLDSNCYNIYMQKQQTSRILYPEYLKAIPSDLTLANVYNCDCLKRGYFESRNVCVVSNDNLSQSSSNVVHRLFACDIKLYRKVAVYFVTNKLNSQDLSTLDVTMLTCIKSGSIRRINLLSKPKISLANNMSILEVNSVKYDDLKYNSVLNGILKKHMKFLDHPNYTGTTVFRMFLFSSTPCDLLEVGVTVRDGSTLSLVEFGIIQLT